MINMPIAPAPRFSLAAGYYAGTQTVTITDAVAGASIYYTTNGQPPTTSSTLYSGPITVSSSETLTAVVMTAGYDPSPRDDGTVHHRIVIDFVYLYGGRNRVPGIYGRWRRGNIGGDRFTRWPRLKMQPEIFTSPTWTTTWYGRSRLGLE